MQFTSDLIIKRNKSLFKELSDKIGLIYIDSYMIAGLLGMKHKKRITEYNEKEDELNDISIPRTVLTNRHRKLDFLWSLCYINEYQLNKDESWFIKKVFETNDSNSSEESKNILNIERVELFHQYALAGIQILYDGIIKRNQEEQIDFPTCIEELLEMFQKNSDSDDIISLD